MCSLVEERRKTNFRRLLSNFCKKFHRLHLSVIWDPLFFDQFDQFCNSVVAFETRVLSDFFCFKIFVMDRRFQKERQIDRWTDPRRMDRETDTWTNRWMDGWKDGWIDGWMDGRIDRKTDRQDKQMDGQTDRWTTDAQVDGQIYRWT